MKKVIFFTLPLILSLNLQANDGAFHVAGNQLIPIIETNISVQKEILSIKRNNNNRHQVDVFVYYEFNNPGEAKSIIVGFEATSPHGDANIEPINNEQPYLHKFMVNMNGVQLPYQVSIVNDSIYYRNGKFKSLTSGQIRQSLDENGDYVDFMYVYHFKADFKKGLNIIKHTYTCELSTLVYNEYTFNYILSAAGRWGNKQIDDFTLNINLGKEQLIDIQKTFFDNTNEWIISGTGKKGEARNVSYFENDTDRASEFYIKEGTLIFQKQNFKPIGELYLSSPVGYFSFEDVFNYKTTQYIYPNMIQYYAYEDMTASDEISKKILRNLPFAKRGYVFSTLELQKYFEQQIWYFPDFSYKADLSKLTREEQKWVQFWSK